MLHATTVRRVVFLGLPLSLAARDILSWNLQWRRRGEPGPASSDIHKDGNVDNASPVRHGGRVV